MANILIIAVNRQRLPYPAAPIGAAMIVGALKKAGHNARLLDLGPVFHVKSAVRRAIRTISPDLVGFSMRNLDSCVMTAPASFLPDVVNVVDIVRRATNVPLIIGGAAFSLAPLEILQALGLEWGVVGEGEEACVALVRRLLSGLSPGDIPGVAGLRTGVSPGANILDLDALPGQDHAQIPLGTYVRWGGFAGIQTRRGCNLTCSYCVYPQLEGRKMRLRSSHKVIDEITAIRRAGCRHFYFVDSAFNHPREHALAICEALASVNLGITWQAYINPTGVDDELARLMKASGCVGVELGLDAACEPMLESMGKNFSLQDIAAASTSLKKADIPFAGHMLFGGPRETWRTITDSAEFLDRHVHANAIFPSIGIRVYRGTGVWKYCLDQGLLDAENPLLAPYYYCSPDLGPSPVAGIDELSIHRPTWSTPTDWNKYSLNMIMRLLGLFQQRPLWKNVRGYGSRKPLIHGRRPA